MLKIAIFIPNLKGGGAERVFVNLAHSFLEKGYKVDFVLIQKKGELLPVLPKSVNVVNLNASRIIKSFLPLKKYLQEEKPDALVAVMWPLTILATVAAKITKFRGKIILSDHTTFSQAPLLKNNLIRKFFKSSLPLIYPFADARLVVSNGVADDLSVLGSLKRKSINVIYNPVSSDLDRFTENQNQEAWNSFIGKKIVAVGALKWAKDYPSLLRAFALLLQKEQAMLSIVGQGDLLSELEVLTKQLNIERYVNFVGFSDVPLSWMESANLLVLSSHYEGLPMVLVESLAVGTPIVSTDCKSGPREILCDGKYGKLVPVGDVDALAQAMLQSLREDHDTEALKLRAADFAVDKIAEQYLDVMFPERSKDNG